MNASTTANHSEDAQSWESLVNRNLPLVKYVLGKLSANLPPHVDRDDLLAAGSVGLVESAKRFDASRNVPFHSYAIPRIWGSMLDELRRHDYLSTDMREQVRKLKRSMNKLQQDTGAKPSAEALAEDLDMPLNRVKRLISMEKLEHRQGDNDLNMLDVAGHGLYSRVGTLPPRGPFETIELEDEKDLLARAIEALPEREKRVIVLRYHEGLYLHEIGEMLKVSESRICQIHSQALRRLKTALKRVGLGV